ncbi:GDSL esterase/lipase at2g40250 [Phtheirospermum japonicum]|uniref:GDSL esterase/lipase at2g40250 n=1 Tax=Phtheirospermum japonicum TaxID=374723 RepID=A0A830D0I1_9LAMI|nr:GDSL esterase/lipase at2g40250 [Phtheirospermum japonicum]
MAPNKYLLIFSLTITLLLPPTAAAQAKHNRRICIRRLHPRRRKQQPPSHHLPLQPPPYGLDFPGRVPTGRFTDGRLSTDILVSELGIKQLLPAYLDPALTDENLLTGASFASAGTGLDDLTAREARVLSPKTQLGYFERALGRMRRAAGREEAGRVVENALFVVAAGSNDMMYNFYGLPLRRTYSVSGYHDLLLRKLEGVIRRLHSMGARRLAVMGLPPIGMLPISHMLQRVCINQQNLDSQAYNAKLGALISRLQPTLPGSRIAYVDIYNPIMDMIKRPAAFGFEKTLEGCCGVGALEMGPLCNAYEPTCQHPSKYIFWDAAHPTEATYIILANYFIHNVLPTLSS